MQEYHILPVSAQSRVADVAGAIAGTVRDHGYAETRSIGAGALNQALKAVIIATGYLREDGINVCVMPRYHEVEIDGTPKTSIVLKIVEFG